tara:strand:+ start:303 stop:524 length:222 start_codon:yes stop_codon:yes gene_type:complete
MDNKNKQMQYITVLDFEVGKVFQYKISDQRLMAWDPDEESCEEFLTHVGHNLQNCEWMTHDGEKIIRTWKNTK